MMPYSVQTLRSAGLEARWARNRKGAPIIVARDPNGRHEHQRSRWWAVDAACWRAMQADGIREGFDSATLLADVFNI